MSIGGKEGHLTFRVASIGAVCVCLNELADGKAIRSFTGRDSGVVAHELVSLSDSFCRARTPRSRMRRRARMLESVPRCLRIVTLAVDRNTAGADLQGHVVRALRALR
jgi:hypothetical protein